MISTLIVALLISFTATAFTVECEVPDMSVYAPQVVFTCTFSEPVVINRLDRIFVPNFVSISPVDGANEHYSITAEVKENTKGEITLFLGKEAFISGDVLSEEYSVSVTYDFVYDNVNVKAVIDTLSMTPDYAVIKITGGQTVYQGVSSKDDIGTFPDCLTVVSIMSTYDAYLVTVYVNDAAALSTSTIRVRAGIIQAYWGDKLNLEKDVSFTLPTTLPVGESFALWPENGAIFTTGKTFSYDVSSLLHDDCMVDISSFRGINADVDHVDIVDGVATLYGSIVDTADAATPRDPGLIEFIGYVPNTCTVASYPQSSTVTIIEEAEAQYTMNYEMSSTGCSHVVIEFNSPMIASSDNVLTISSKKNTYAEQTNVIHRNHMGQFLLIESTICISADSDVFYVNINNDVVMTPTQQRITLQEPLTLFISKMSLVLTMREQHTDKIKQGVYVMPEESFKLAFNTPSDIALDVCDFSNAFSSDYHVELSSAVINGDLVLDVHSTSIDHHNITFDASKVTCDGSFAVEFVPSFFHFAYDPAFLPGDIVITRVNSYYSPEFDFVPLRKVYTWNKIFFTDEGWVHELYGFIDHGSDGCISWTPKTDVEAGTVQQWSYVAMTQSLDRTIPRVVNTDYSFNYEKHGFLLDFQDNLFIYVTDSQDLDSKYDSQNINFIFGLYWSASEWAEQTTDYHKITAEYSSLPNQLQGYNIALGIDNSAMPRGVNYMAIKQENFNTFTNTYYHMIEKIINKDNWVTSQKDRFTTSPLVSYLERPMDFTVESKRTDKQSICFTFATPYTVNYDANLITVQLMGKDVAFTVAPEFSTAQASYCINFDMPTTEGEIVVDVREGAFFYTTDATSAPYVFKNVAYSTSFIYTFKPELTVTYSADKIIQLISIESTVDCAEWAVSALENAGMIVVEKSAKKLSLAAHLLPSYVFSLPEGFCVSYDDQLSAAKTFDAINVDIPSVEASLLKDVNFIGKKTNQPHRQVLAHFTNSWTWTDRHATLDDEVVATIKTNEDAIYLEWSNYTGNEDAVKAKLTLPSGMRALGQVRSIAVNNVEWDYAVKPINVIDHVALPWETPITQEGIYNTAFHLEIAPSVGSHLPSEVLYFNTNCRSLGYIMYSDMSTIMPVAVMHGTCNYGVNADSIIDSYGNSNEAYTNTVEFDFLPPVGTISLMETLEDGEDKINTRYYWNHSPIVAIFFNELVDQLNTSLPLIDVPECDVDDAIYAIENNKSVLRYTLSNCGNSNTIQVIPDIEIMDHSGNAWTSQESLKDLPLTFEMDTTAPSVVLSSTTNVIYGSSIDISYEVSEEETDFTCQSIGVAIQDVGVTVTAKEGNVCHYEFNPLPVNGTYILFHVPAGRFMDKARNPNVASNTLVPLILNKGAQIHFNAPAYTNQVQTEFTISIDYTWLCADYDYIFPSTLQYDTEIARIEKTGSVVDEDGVITQSFVITFFNFDNYAEERYKNIPIYVPAMVCKHPAGLYNEAASFNITFDNTPTVPTFDLTMGETDQNNFNVDISFEDMKEFGANEPSSYIQVAYAADYEAINCDVTRHAVDQVFTYSVSCPYVHEGDVIIAIARGAVVELTGIPSAEAYQTFFVDMNPPVFTLASEQTTFGPNVDSISVDLTVNEIMSELTKECFVFEGADDLNVDVILNGGSLTYNQVIAITMTRKTTLIPSGYFNVYIKDHCAKDIHNNYNIKSNVLTFHYDFVAPVITIDCPTSNTVLNSITMEGTFNEPIAEFTTANVIVPSVCSARSVSYEGLNFSMTVSCYETGVFEFSVSGIKDLVGNVAEPSNTCAASFTIYGPTIKYTIHDLIRDEYINTKDFSIEITAEPGCVSMNLNDTFVIVENADHMTYTKLTPCRWTISGESIEEGSVFIRVLEGVAVDIYGGLSLSSLIKFRSYQSTPSIMSVSPKSFASDSTNDVTVCYDWNIIRGEGLIVPEGACDSATIKEVTNNCVTMTVDFTSGDKCHLLLQEDFVQTEWNIGSENRYVTLEVDELSPVVEAVMVVNNEEKQAVANIFKINQNGVMKVPIPSGVQVHLSKVHFSESVVVEHKEAIEVAIALVGDSSMSVTFDEGFFEDRYGRKSGYTEYTIKQKIVDLTVTYSNLYQSASPLVICPEFNSEVILTQDNVMCLQPFTIEKTQDCMNQITIPVTEEGDILINLTGVKDTYGNVLPTVEPITVTYYNTQPTCEPIEDVVMSTRVTPTEGTLTMIFNHKMADIPSTLDEMFTVTSEEDVSLDALFTINEITTAMNVIVIKMVPQPSVVNYVSYTCELNPTAFVDLAEKTVAPTTFNLIIDNRNTEVASVLVNKDKFFSSFPVTLEVTFTKPITLGATPENHISAMINNNLVTFTLQGIDETNTVLKFTSVESYETALNDVMTVVVQNGMGIDHFGGATVGKQTELIVSRGATLTDQKMKKNNEITLVFNMKIQRVNPSLIKSSDAVVDDIIIEDNTVTFIIYSIMQGPWSIDITKGAIIGSDDYEETTMFTISGIWDNIAPIVSCAVPETIGAGEVIIPCTFSEKVQTDNQFFEISRDDDNQNRVILNHDEIWNEDATQLNLHFVGIEQVEPGKQYSININLHSCKDMNMNACLPALYTALIDFVQPVATLDTTYRYVHNNETIIVVLTFDKYIVTPITTSMLQITAPEFGEATVLDVYVEKEGYRYAFPVVLGTDDFTDTLVPFTFTFGEQVKDNLGNMNTESTLEVMIKDIIPELRVENPQRDEKQITMKVVVTYGPMNYLTQDAIELSNTLQFVDLKFLSTVEMTSEYELTVSHTCTTSCEYSIRFVAEKIFDDGGNRLDHDVVVSDVIAMQPVLTVDDMIICSGLTCNMVIHSSENVDMNCESITIYEDNYQMLPAMCLNTKECVCTVTTTLTEVESTIIMYEIEKDTAVNMYHLGNEPKEGMIWQSTMRMEPILMSNFTPDSIANIKFVVSWPGYNMTVNENMIHCENCEIHDFELINSLIFNMYQFYVDFYDENDRYAIVSIEDGALLDPFGRYTLGKEMILRREIDPAHVAKMTVTKGSTYKISLQFTKEVTTCGGVITLNPMGHEDYRREFSSDDSNVHINGRNVDIFTSVLPDTRYVLSFNDKAFCDDTAYPADTACPMCVFQTNKGAPLPIGELKVVEVNVHNATVHYSGIIDSGDAIQLLHITTTPSSKTGPIIIQSPKLEDDVVITGLEGNTYYVGIAMITNSYGSSYSSFIEFTTLPTTPESASDLRICDVINPTTVGKNSYVYTTAKACWSKSISSNVEYNLKMIPLVDGVEGEATVIYTGEENEAVFTVGNDVTAYRLVLETISQLTVLEGSERTSIQNDFVTAVNLEQITKYPQGANIKIVSERLSAEDVKISFTHPLENYFAIDRYLVQYGNVFEDVFNATNNVMESLPFRMEQCTGNAVTVTVRAGVLNNFYGLPSNRVTVYCKKPRFIIRTEPGYNFVTYSVASEIAGTAVCTLKSNYAASGLATETIKVSPLSEPTSYVFKSLEPNTDYSINCEGYDLDFAPISGHAAFTTIGNFELPYFEVGNMETTKIGASFAEIPIEAVNMPGTVYCVVAPIDKSIQYTRGRMLKEGQSTYVYPGSDAKTVLMTHLTPATHYHARCLFDPDYNMEMTPVTRRLVDTTTEFVTATVPTPEWTDFSPKKSSVVPVNTKIILTARLPIEDYVGYVSLICTNCEKDADQRISTLLGNIVVKNNQAIITPYVSLLPGKEYTVLCPLGTFVDAETHYPLPAITERDQFTFIVTSDKSMITAPTVIQSVPAEGSISDLVSMNVIFTFDRDITIGNGIYTVSLKNADTVKYVMQDYQVKGRSLILDNTLFFDEGEEVTIVLATRSICNLYGACNEERITLHFSVGNHDFEPSLIDIFPANDAIQVPANADIEMTFNKKMMLSNDFEITFVDEEGHTIVLNYQDEKMRVYPRISVEDNMIIFSGQVLNGGHTYSVYFDNNKIMDQQGRNARGIPTIYGFSYSQYTCSGSYINEDMSDNCSCFLTSHTCECWCGEAENIKDVLIRLTL